MRRRRDRAVAWAMLLLAGAACSEAGFPTTSAGALPTWSPPGKLPCAKLADAPSATRQVGPFRIDDLVSLSYQGDVAAPHAWDNYAVYTVDLQRVVVCDLASGTTATVAEAGAEPGLVQRPAGSGSTVVYTRLFRVARLSEVGTAWTGWAIEAVDVRTGRRWVLDSTEDKRAPETEFGALPLPAIEGPWVAWLRARTTSESDLWTVDLRSGRRRLVATLPTGARIGLSDGVVAYDRITSADFMERDLYLVPADGSKPPERVAKMAGQWPDFGSGLVAWADLVAKAQPPARYHDQREIWVYEPGSDTEPRRLGAGAGPQPGSGFVMTSTEGRLELYDVSQPGEPAHLFAPEDQLTPFSSASVNGDMVVWTVRDGQSGTFTLSRITHAVGCHHAVSPVTVPRGGPPPPGAKGCLIRED